MENKWGSANALSAKQCSLPREVWLESQKVVFVKLDLGDLTLPAVSGGLKQTGLGEGEKVQVLVNCIQLVLWQGRHYTRSPLNEKSNSLCNVTTQP